MWWKLRDKSQRNISHQLRQTLCESGRCIAHLKKKRKRGRVLKKWQTVVKKLCLVRVPGVGPLLQKGGVLRTLWRSLRILTISPHTTYFPRAHVPHKINGFFAFIFGSDPVPKTITNNLDASPQSLLLRWFNGWFCDPSPQSFGALTLTKSHAFMRNTCQ